MKLSQRVQLVAESATLAVSAKAAQLRSEGVDVIGFGAGEPDFPTPAHIVAAAAKALADGFTRYSSPSSGLAVAKDAVCLKLRRENDLAYKREQVIITTGGKNACHLVIQTLIDPGDEVIIPVPYWVSYPEIVRLAGGVPVFVEGKAADGFRVTPDQIRAAISGRTRLLIMNYPSNPCGHMYTADQVREIARVVANSHVMVLADEIYDRLVFGDVPFVSFAAVGSDAYERTITVNSASKTYAMPGWRLAFAAGPVDVIRGMSKLQSQNTSGAATFSQVAYAAALSGDQSCVDRMREAFSVRGRRVHELLTAIPGVRCVEPQGAFYVFPDVSALFSRLGVSGSLEFAGKLLDEAHVAVVPGAAFGADAHVRISFATSLDQIEKGVGLMAEWVARRA